MGDALRRLEIAVAWRLMEICHWGEQLLWERYDHDFVARYILPGLDREVEEPSELADELDLDTNDDDIPF